MEQHEMDADGLTSLSLTESDLINLQQAGVLVTNQGTPHFTQTDLETLASIQDDLETFNIDASQEEIVDIADLAKDVGGQFSIADEHLSGYESGLGLDINLVSSIGSQNIANEAAENLESVPIDRPESGQTKTIQIVRATGGGFNKLKLSNTNSNQQIRIQPASAARVSSTSASGQSSSGQQLKFVNIFPQTKPKGLFSEGQVVNILNSDGSISSITLPGSQENVQVLNSDGSIGYQGLQLPAANQTIQIGTASAPAGKIPIAPATSQQLQISSGTDYQIGSGGQSLQIVGSGNQTVQLSGSTASAVQLSGSSAVQLSAAAGQAVQLGGGSGAQVLQIGQIGSNQLRNSLPSGSRLAVSGTSGQTVKLMTAGGQSYRVISGGKVIGDQSPRKPASPLKPGQGQLLRTADGKILTITSGKKIVLSSAGQPIKTEKPVAQVIRLQPDSVNSANKLQFVRVVNSQGESQTVQIKLPEKSKPTAVPVQGVKKLTNSGGGVPTQTSIQKEIAQVKKELVSVETQGLKPRKPCNCTKSLCLKLYCDCFANGEFCFNCNCTNCHNNLENEEDRQRSIRQCLDRNPNAFRPKIGKNPSESDRRHNKGCNCKRSGCLKNYCECYEAKIICTDICKCVGCKNVDERTGTKVASLNFVEEHADESLSVSEKWFKPTSSLRSKLLQAPNLNLQDTSVKKAPFSFVTQEVVEATCQCLLAQAEDGEKNSLSEGQIERQVLEEFGRCLSQIIDFASKTKQ